MKIYYDCDGTCNERTVDDFYHDVAKIMGNEPLDSNHEVTVRVDGMAGEVRYLITRRSGTRFIREVDNTLPASLHDSEVKEVFLTCVDPVVNAYKFYRLTPLGSDVIASYGRMGTRKGELFGERSYTYPISMFWVKYYEKVTKGYVDRSNIYLNAPGDSTRGNDGKEPGRKEKVNGVSVNLFEKLTAFAKKAVREAKVSIPITDAIISYVKDNIKTLNRIAEDISLDEPASVSRFNEVVLDIVAALQRPVQTGDGSGVKRLLAGGRNDFRRIIERESDLVSAMEGTGHGYTGNSQGFGRYGIEVYIATDKQRGEVIAKLSDSLKGKVKNVYRVIDNRQKSRFNDYMEKNNITKVKRFWHGSRNENWASIIINSLQLNPNAVITGKMFGQGIYFAPSSMKSWNYTSYRGTSWANGSSDTAYMALFATAYGRPFDVDTWSSVTDYRSATHKNGCDCLHAHAGTSLRNDEIVFYDERAVLLQYLVEFE